LEEVTHVGEKEADKWDENSEFARDGVAHGTDEDAHEDRGESETDAGEEEETVHVRLQGDVLADCGEVRAVGLIAVGVEADFCVDECLEDGEVEGGGDDVEEEGGFDVYEAEGVGGDATKRGRHLW